MARFLLQMGDHHVRLTPGVWRVGRDAACEIRVADETVSRRHVSLHVGDDGVRLADDGSRNGVLVNDVRIRGSVALSPGDRIKLGMDELRLLDEDADAPAAAFGGGTRPLPKVPKRDEGLDSLSARERDVFARLARGQTQRAIAEELGVSVKTVETYRARIGTKLGVHSRSELVQRALEAGVLRPD